MPVINHDLHGNAPDTSAVALLLIDFINDFDFDDAEELFVQTLPVAHAVAALKQRAKRLGIPCIYINDNFGRWQSNFQKLVDHCLNDDVMGRPIVELLRPEDDDYFVLKPKHSGFYSTTLDVLLDYLQSKTLILTGIAGNICVLFTANDAYMRDFHIIVPHDCIASVLQQDNDYALHQIETVLKADIRASRELDLEALLQKPAVSSGKKETSSQRES